jgi:hypothetical protein
LTKESDRSRALWYGSKLPHITNSIGATTMTEKELAVLERIAVSLEAIAEKLDNLEPINKKLSMLEKISGILDGVITVARYNHDI